MKKGVVVFLHLGYWLLYCLLLLFVSAIILEANNPVISPPVGLGVRFLEQERGLKIEHIIKEGPADKQGVLKAGDEIIKFTLSTGDTVDVQNMPTQKSRELFKGAKGTKVSLVVRQRNGNTKIISIVRDEFPANLAPTFRHWFLLMLDAALIPGMIAFYCFYTFLVSRFLSKRKIFAFVVLGVLVSLFTALPAELMMYFTLNGNIVWNPGICLGVGLLVATNALLNGVVGLVMRGFIGWYGDIKLKEDLTKKNYETELALIRSQINPHFLFNTINNIDVLIMKNPELASSYLNKLSDMMRFMLYETKTEKIPLGKELEYISKYVELQKIRTANPNYIKYDVKGDPKALLIDAMLFIPFIENAFKHSENKKIDNAINIFISVEGNTIHFECANRYAAATQVKPEYGGLGNELISRRLALLYPGKHT